MNEYISDTLKKESPHFFKRPRDYKIRKRVQIVG